MRTAGQARRALLAGAQCRGSVPLLQGAGTRRRAQDPADEWTVCAGFNLTSVLERPDGKGSSLEDALGGEEFFAPPAAHLPPVRRRRRRP